MNKDIRRSWYVIALVVVLTVISGVLVSKLQFNYDFEEFFPQNDPATEYFIEYRNSFESDFDYFIVVLENPTGVFDSTFLSRVDSLNNRLKQVNNIVEAVGPTQVMDVVQDPMFGGFFSSHWLNYRTPENYAADSSKIYQNGQWIGIFFSPDAKSVAINMKHTPGLAVAKCDQLYADIDNVVVNEFGFKDAHLIGRAKGQKLYVELMVRELVMFIIISLICTIGFLYIAFRSLWGVAIPSIIVLLSILFTMAFMKIVGKEIDLMMTVLPTIIFVVGMSDSVHVLTKYMQEIRSGKERVHAIKSAFKSIRLATFLTAVTTSIGFLTLVFSNIKPISDFGIYTSVGVLLAYGLTYTILPAIIIVAHPKRLADYAVKEDYWYPKLHRALQWIFRKRKFIMITTGVLLVVSIWGISRITVDNLMLEDLRETHPLKKDFTFMEARFAGCRPFELCVELKDDVNPFDPTVLKQVDTLSHYLSQEYGVGAMFSLSEMVRSANRSLNAGMHEYRVVPAEDYELRKIERFLKRKDMREITRLTYNQEQNRLRFAGRLSDIGRKHYEGKNAELAQFLQNNCPDLVEHHVTGTAFLMDLNNAYLVDNMLLDLLLSVTVIGLVMGIVYKNWKMIPLTIIPNLIPLIIVSGIMGFAGIPLKVSTSIVFNIAFGIAVDDTIHFLARVRTLLGEGRNKIYAVKRTFMTTGKAMIVTTLILSGGFSTLIFSEFLGTFYIGLLISMTLFIALLFELTITPIVVITFFKESKRKQKD
jgi:predicted RND superfamily exporter protein